MSPLRVLRALRHRGDRASGQGLVEFSLVAPIFFLTIFAIIQLGLLFGAQNGLVSAVRDTARYAATYRVGDTTDSTTVCSTYVLPHILQAKKTMMPGWIASAPQHVTVTYHWQANPTNSGYFVEVIVEASYALPLYVPLVSNILDNTTPHPSTLLRAREEMRVENPALAYTRSDVVCNA